MTPCKKKSEELPVKGTVLLPSMPKLPAKKGDGLSKCSVDKGGLGIIEGLEPSRNLVLPGPHLPWRTLGTGST